MVRLDVTQNDSCVSTYGLEVLLELGVERTRLESNDLGSSIGVMGNRGATFGAEDTVDVKARRSLARVLLGGAVDGELFLGNDRDQGCSRLVRPLCTSSCVLRNRRQPRGNTHNRSSHSGAGSRHSGRRP